MLIFCPTNKAFAQWSGLENFSGTVVWPACVSDPQGAVHCFAPDGAGGVQHLWSGGGQ